SGVGRDDGRRRGHRGRFHSVGTGPNVTKRSGSKKTVAITGGSGFIGSHVVDALLDAGYRVRVLDTRPPERVEADWAQVDVMHQDRLTQAVRGTDAIFHLAAMADVNDIFASPVDSVALNTVGTVR